MFNLCRMMNQKHLLVAIASLLIATGLPLPARAVTRVGELCTIAGQSEMTLRGIGLVVGLNGTGDPNGSAATIRPFAAYLKLANNPILSQDELRDLSSVAVVEVTATVPRHGISKGQKIDCYVSTLFGAESLAGGRLVVAPLESASIAEDLVLAVASGSIEIEDTSHPTTGRISSGALMSHTIDMNIEYKPRHLRLLIKRQFADFAMAREIANSINTFNELQNSYQSVATPISSVAIDVAIPTQYDNPVEFAALLMDVAVVDVGNRARVVVNAKQGTIVVTGNVEISPVAIAHRNLNVEITDPFVDVGNQSIRQAPQQLTDLVTALNQLKVPTADIIAILRHLHESGSLHAEFLEL
ncbi:MAG: flagellar basal body P-ring protein FlgI [Planctomycetota bacterium]|jgi:flagellar P-ring protein precursor FlgI